jgi:hypothetical protein
MYSDIIRLRKAEEDRAMRTYKMDNMVITREVEDRFFDMVRGYLVDESGKPIAFLGKFKVQNNFTEEEIINLYPERKKFIEETLKLVETQKNGGQTK